MLTGSRRDSVSRRSRTGALALVVASAIALASAAAPASAATLQYPNLETLAPRDLRFDTADVDASEATVMHNVLRFSNTVWNDGAGPLEVRGLIDPTTKTGPATQRVYDNGGGFTDFPAGSFYYHPAHQHYHYDNWGRYELWTKAGYEAWLASGRTVGNPTVGAKTTSCMIDEEFIRNVPNQPYPPVYDTEGCFPDSKGNMRQGISPGWGDTYDYFRFEQWIDLGEKGSLPDGQYVLRSVVDPTNKIYESPNKADPAKESQEANEAITAFAVQKGQLVDSNPPTGSVRVNNIDASTTSPNVTVRVLGRDDISGVTQVRLSNDGSSWGSWIAYTGKESTAQAIAWNLTATEYGGNNLDGTKTVYAQFKDASGKLSAPESDTILLDRGGGSSAYSNSVLADSPVGYWRLGEKSGMTANDASGGGHNGTYKNGALLGQPSLLPGDSANTSVRFDGTNDLVAIPSSSALSPAAKVSVEAWIKPGALPTTGNFASVASKPESYSIQFNGPKLEFTIIQSGTRHRLQAPSGTILTGQAYHVVGTYDGTTQRLYVNGAEVANAPLTGAITANSNALDIGSWNEGSEDFNGTIDEVAVYAGALSSAKVGAHYEAGTGLAPPDETVKDPSNLTATAVSSSEIDLKWVDNSTNEGEFLIERDTSPTFPAPTILPTWANATSYEDTGLNAGTTYYYRVRARNSTDSSGYSNTANATTLASKEEEPPPPPEYSPTVLADSPVGYWRLGEKSGMTANDASGGGHNGTYKNGALLGQPSLLPGDSANTSVRFDGTNDLVAIPSSSALSPAAKVSVEAWIKPNALPTTGNFASVASKPESYSIQFNGPRLEFTIMQSKVRHRLQAPVGAVVVGQAYHVVGTYDGATQRLYVNGVEVANAPLTGAITTNTNALDIGSWNEGSEDFNGTIDEVAVYAGVLSPARVTAHYQAGTATAKTSAISASASYSPTSAPTFGYYCHLHTLVAARTPLSSTPWLQRPS